MKIKKLNAILSLVTVALYLCHAIVSLLAVFGVITDRRVSTVIGWIFMAALCLHAVIALIIILCNLGEKNGKKQYLGLNKGFYLQRISAIVAVVTVHFHVSTTLYLAWTQTAAGCVALILTNILFFASVGLHISNSFGKAFVTLGLVNSEKTLSILNKVSFITVAVITLACSASIVWFFINVMKQL